MHPAIEDMLKPYQCKNPGDYKNALKEIIQEIALLGLSRQGFFERAAFYGGSSLRIAHNLDRFSEDLDFTLLQPDPDYRLDLYLKGIEDELRGYQLELQAEIVGKKTATPVTSAFLKGNTLRMLLAIDGLENPASGTHVTELIKVKIEIDTDPPQPSGHVEAHMQMKPIPFSIRILTLESLFAGKLHAILTRNYPSGRVKGRDYYDFAWFRARNIIPDLPYLEAKLRQSGVWKSNADLTAEHVIKFVLRKLAAVNWEKAKEDVLPFLKDPFAVQAWSLDFFSRQVDALFHVI